MTQSSASIAILVPCYNEEITIPNVVRDYLKYLPNATVYVYDNNSKDDTALVAAQAGASVRRVIPQGKGNVVRQMFVDIDADVYILVDGDDTYDAASAPAMVEQLINDRLDMIVGVHVTQEVTAYQFGGIVLVISYLVAYSLLFLARGLAIFYQGIVYSQSDL